MLHAEQRKSNDVSTDARLWIEVLPSTEAKKIFIDEIGYAKPLYTTELSPGTSGRIEVGPIPEPGRVNSRSRKETFDNSFSTGSYNVILFKVRNIRVSFSS